MMKRRILHLAVLLLPFVCLALELLPWGAVMLYAHPLPDGGVDYTRVTCSYFSYALRLLCFSSGEFGAFFLPFFTLLAALFALRWFLRGRGRAGIVVFAALGLAAALSPLFAALYLHRALFDLTTPLALVLGALLAAEAVCALLAEPLQKIRKK